MIVVLVIAFQIVVELQAAKKVQGTIKAIVTMKPRVMMKSQSGVNAMRTQSLSKRRQIKMKARVEQQITTRT